jgi:hypothetical protein
MRARYLAPVLLVVMPAVVAAQAAAPAPAAATPGKSHICLAPSSVETASGTAAQAMSAVKETFTSFLTGPTLEVAALQSRLPSQAKAEAKAANCPYVLLTTLKQVHKGGGGPNLFGRAAAGAVSGGASAAGGLVGSPGGAVAANATAGAANGAASSYGSSTQSKDELTLSTHLENADGKVLVDETDKRTAQSNGEDMLTPLVEKAATAVANAVAAPGK